MKSENNKRYCDQCKKPIRGDKYVLIVGNPEIHLHFKCWDDWDRDHDAPIDYTNKDKPI